MPVRHYTNKARPRWAMTEKQLKRARLRDRKRRRDRDLGEQPEVTIKNVEKIMVRPEPQDQATRVINKFGGARRLASLINQLHPGEISITPSSIYRWTYPRSRGGCGGVIPTASIPLVLKAAKLDGVFLSPDDLFPGVK